TVTFHLNRPDATFPQKIASGAGSIVNHREYPADALRAEDITEPVELTLWVTPARFGPDQRQCVAG
ncbi:hypothetical protein ACFV01_34305, partial [Streptomyces sp. NPDC059616]